jgi:2-succinyl-6-hydroxy-2,4-cyclohexadiene-1-carboxylate synthase
VLESASPGLATERDRDERRAADHRLASQIEDQGIEWFVDYWEHLPTFSGQNRLDPALRLRQRELRLRNDPRSLAAALRGLGTGALPSLWDRLARIAQPTLLVVGEQDQKFVATAELMASSMPNTRVAVIPGAGHNVHLEAPSAWLDAVVGFLS